MYFFIDNNKKIIFGWSPKCGSTHVKKLFSFLTDSESVRQELPANHSEYKIILFLRNPFERVVSAFRFLYKQGGYCRASIIQSSNQKITFRDFVDELVSKGTHDPLNHSTILGEHSKLNIDKYHFDPQVSGSQIDVHKIYDILNIDYSYIETLYSVTIPQEIRDFKGPNVNVTPLQTKYGLGEKLQLSDETEAQTKVFDLEVDETQNQNLSLTQFYNQDIVNKVAEFYKKDLEFIKRFL
jgi:hypothetical protein